MTRRLDRHAPGVLAGKEFTLCGVAMDAYESGDADEPVRFARDGEVVTCEDCRSVIGYVRTHFTGRRYVTTPRPDAPDADRRGRAR